MSNNVTSNPLLVDTAAASTEVWSGVKKVQLIQWVDDNGDIPNGGNLIIIVNGVSLEATIVRATASDLGGEGAVLWEMQFPLGVKIWSFQVPTMATGHLHIWCA